MNIREILTESAIGGGVVENQERLQPKPYVVSGDIEGLLGQWTSAKGLAMPRNGLIRELRADFTGQMKTMFPGFEFVPEEELATGLRERVKETDLFPISMDRVYFQTEPRIDIARIIDANGEDRGLGARHDAESLFRQFRRLRELGIDKATLVDDVLFSGGLVNRIRTAVGRLGIDIPVVCAGIAIQDGITMLAEQGVAVKAVRTYDAVEDEVCERDYYPGVPLSGRVVAGNGNIGAPYVLPFGNPEKWASIPADRQVAFSKACINRSIALFKEIERASGKTVTCADLDRGVNSLPRDNTRFVDAIKQFA
jgi:hypothetical protein